MELQSKQQHLPKGLSPYLAKGNLLLHVLFGRHREG